MRSLQLPSPAFSCSALACSLWRLAEAVAAFIVGMRRTERGSFWKSLCMTESDLDKLWNVVPVGEANAAAASKIWKRFDMWTRPTIQHNLRWMADAGRIHRVSRPMPMGGVVRLYYR
jgi:hypothetical protein